jgi:dolichol kinase
MMLSYSTPSVINGYPGENSVIVVRRDLCRRRSLWLIWFLFLFLFFPLVLSEQEKFWHRDPQRCRKLTRNLHY